MRDSLHARMLAAIALVALVAVAGGATAALAAPPIKGATYKGKIKLPHESNVTFQISFKVSAKGKLVSNFSLPNDYPVYCQGGGFGQVQAGSSAITKKGKFTVKLPIYFAPAHQHQGFVIITGTFAKHGKESGKVKTDFTTSHVCNGTATYTTTG
jgi:hypothetical protein